MSKYKYNIVDGIDHIIDEKGNTFIALRKMYWGDNPDNSKLELRKYYNNADGTETPSKGVTFITEEGPNNLAHTLVEMGFGNTKRLLDSIKDRDDFRPSLNQVLGSDDEYYDSSIPEDIYVDSNDLFDYED